MSGGSSRNDEKYDVNAPLFKSIVQLAKLRGYEIGIHPSYNSYDDYEMITTEKNRLQQSIGGKISSSRQQQ